MCTLSNLTIVAEFYSEYQEFTLYTEYSSNVPQAKIVFRGEFYF